MWTENVRCVFRVKTPFSSFSSGAFRRGPEAGINKWSIRSHKLAYSKRKEITSMKGVDFLQLLYKRCGLKKKTPPNLEFNHVITVLSFVYFYAHSINEALREMIKCSSFIVDNVAAVPDLGRGCRGCAPPPPEMTCGFLIQLVFTSVH